MSHELLFAVLEASTTENPPSHDTVAIVGLDGRARAKAMFQPRQRPEIGNAAPLLQNEAHVAAGAVYYFDRAGTVRRLTPLAQVNRVVFFPVNQAQQELSFAVSPDGSDFYGAVVTIPPLVSPGADNPAPFPVPGSGPYHLEIEHARAAGPTTTLVDTDVANVSPLKGLVNVVGWNAAGPLVTTETMLGSQQGTLGRDWFGNLAHLDVHGRAGPTLGGAGCMAVAATDDDTVACLSPTWDAVSVRRAGGTLVWALPASPNVQYLGPYALSSDGNRLAIGGDRNQGAVYNRDGTKLDLPKSFKPKAWLDESSLIGYTGDAFSGPAEMAFVRLTTATETIDLGFKATYVGLVQAGPTTAGP